MRQRVIQFLRQIRLGVWYLFRAIGLFTLVASSDWRKRRLLILCYHGVSIEDEHKWHPGLFVTSEFLASRLQTLKELGYNVLRLDDAVQRLRKGTLPEKSVAITFDDGFYNFFCQAAPILEEFGMPATNYVSTYYVVNQQPITSLTARYLVWAARNRTLPRDSVFPGHDRVNLDSSDQSAEFIDAFLDLCDRHESDKCYRLLLLEKLALAAGLDWSDFHASRRLGLMSFEELAEMSRRGFDMQLHTHRHRTPRNDEKFVWEVSTNRKCLERATGATANHFCYPSGDVDEMFLPLLKELGVQSATTGNVRLATSTDNPLLLPRFVDTMAQSNVQFESWLCGAADLFGRWGR